jgi:hypothetical protein
LGTDRNWHKRCDFTPCVETRACVEKKKKENNTSSGVKIEGLHRTYRGEYKKESFVAAT